MLALLRPFQMSSTHQISLQFLDYPWTLHCLKQSSEHTINVHFRCAVLHSTPFTSHCRIKDFECYDMLVHNFPRDDPGLSTSLLSPVFATSFIGTSR